MKNPFRKVFLCGAAALMLAAPAYGLAATQIERSGNTSSRADCLRVFKPEICGVQPTVPTPEPVEQLDETGFPLLDPADVTKYCTPTNNCTLLALQDAYDAAKLFWRETIASDHPEDTQIALKEASVWRRRDKPFSFYTMLKTYLEVHLRHHRLYDVREFKP